MKAVFFFFSHCTFLLVACAQPETSPVAQVTEHQLLLGETTVTVQETSFATPLPFFFVHLHGNEITAAEVAQAIALKEGIPLLRIVNGEERLLSFRQDNQSFRFDPNRIFSDSGIQKTLVLYNKLSEPAFATIKAFRDTLLTFIDTSNLVIALHNNTNERFSILQYKAANALVHINSEQDPDDFFLTNDRELFEKLRETKYNVVLEDASAVEDDGSLSVYCSRQNIRYVNVEAEHGHVQEQTAMLNHLLQLLQ